jgi:hypothetical protein
MISIFDVCVFFASEFHHKESKEKGLGHSRAQDMQRKGMNTDKYNNYNLNGYGVHDWWGNMWVVGMLERQKEKNY